MEYSTSYLEIINSISVTVLAAITIILSVITAWHANITKKVFKLQEKAIRKTDILYALENVYSPLNNLIDDFMASTSLKLVDVQTKGIHAEASSSVDEWYEAYNLMYHRIKNIQHKYFHVIIFDEQIRLYLIALAPLVTNELAIKKENGTVEINSKVALEVGEISFNFMMHIVSQITEYNEELGMKPIKKWEDEGSWGIEFTDEVPNSK